MLQFEVLLSVISFEKLAYCTFGKLKYCGNFKPGVESLSCLHMDLPVSQWA